jgi:ethanolamine transporter EutH
VSDRRDDPLLDFAEPLARARRLVVPLVALALLAALVEGALLGFSAGAVVRWLAVAAVVGGGLLAVLTALHALGGADRAQRRGERLSGDDVRLRPPLPRRRRR